MTMTASNVRIDKTISAGSVWVAPTGTALPTDTSTELDVAFQCVGYLLKGGVTNHNDRTSTNIVADGGDIVAVASSDDVDSYEFTMLETNAVSQKLIRGEDNVTTVGDLLVVKHNSTELNHYAVVVERVANGKKRRITAADAQCTARGDIQYQDEDATAYPATLTCFPDSNGDKSIEYIETESSESSSSSSSAG